MTFSDQFIKVLDALCDKVGITIDWTSTNVFPYLQDLMQRFIKYETYTSILWLIIGLVLFVFFLTALMKISKNEYVDEITISVCLVISIAGFLLAISQAIDIIEVNTIPEKTIIEYVKNMNEY